MNLDLTLVRDYVYNEDSCEGSVGFDAMTMYQPYIDGEKEIAQINMEFRSGIVK